VLKNRTFAILRIIPLIFLGKESLISLTKTWRKTVFTMHVDGLAR
jgi:hypothetical protein